MTPETQPHRLQVRRDPIADEQRNEYHVPHVQHRLGDHDCEHEDCARGPVVF